jgi:hypothetical protein
MLKLEKIRICTIVSFSNKTSEYAIEEGLAKEIQKLY